MAEISKQALIVENNTSFPNNNNGQITPSVLRAFNNDMIDSTVNQTVFSNYSSSVTESLQALSAFTASIQQTNAFTQSADIRLDNLESWSASLDTNFASQAEFDSYTSSNDAKVDALIAFTSSVLSVAALQPLNEFTASVAGTNVFTASIAGTNEFTASIKDTNAFTQSIQAQVNDIQDKTGSFATTGSNTFYGDEIVSGNVDVRDNIYAAYIDMKNAPNGNGGSIFFRASGSNVIPGSKEFWSLNPIFQDGDFAIVAQPSNEKAISFGLNDGYVKFWQGLRLEPGFKGWDVGNTQLIISSSTGNANVLEVRGNITASLQEGYALVGGAGNVTNALETSSFAAPPFTNPSLISISGSLALIANTFASASSNFEHISESADNQANLLFKNNNNTASTIISGSSNIYTNPAAPTAGFVRYMTAGNIGVGGSGAAVPQISSSMAWSPSINNNVFASSTTPLTWRGAVSASSSTVNNNVLAGGIINLGLAPTAGYQRAEIGTNVSNNLLAGTLGLLAFKSPLSSAVAITSNNVGGNVTLAMDSSSVNFNGNTVQGVLTVNNSYFPTTFNATSANFSLNSNLFIGTNNVYASGSNTTFTGPSRVVTGAAMVGTANVISASLNGNNSSVNSTIVLGQSLTVIGSNSRPTAPTAVDWGSAFVGRWNAIDGNRARTAETVFAVGTGTSAANRKTAFLIDSGSNTFVEGTLNVSGSTTLSGSVVSNVINLSITSETASLDFNLGNLFQLDLVSGSTTRLEATNIKAGQTINLLVSQPGVGYGDLVYDSTFKFTSGNSYVPTQVAAAKDVVTFLTFADTTAIYGASVKNLV